MSLLLRWLRRYQEAGLSLSKNMFLSLSFVDAWNPPCLARWSVVNLEYQYLYLSCDLPELTVPHDCSWQFFIGHPLVWESIVAYLLEAHFGVCMHVMCTYQKAYLGAFKLIV